MVMLLILPVQLTNYLLQSIGLDTCLAVQRTLYEGTSDSKYRPSILLERMVDAQWFGRKNGKGFYEYWTCCSRSRRSVGKHVDMCKSNSLWILLVSSWFCHDRRVDIIQSIKLSQRVSPFWFGHISSRMFLGMISDLCMSWNRPYN